MAEQRILMMDTCGERASLALARDGVVCGEAVLEERAASTGLLQAVRELLQRSGVALRELTAVGVVNGPGSFTGVRIGLAVSKGLCEALGVPLATVSRLAVLAQTGVPGPVWAVLRAGRDEVYVRGQGVVQEGEMMLPHDELLARLQETPGASVRFAEESLVPLLGTLPHAQRVALEAAQALPLVRAALAAGGTELALADANYVRPEDGIYRRQRAGA